MVFYMFYGEKKHRMDTWYLQPRICVLSSGVSVVPQERDQRGTAVYIYICMSWPYTVVHILVATLNSGHPL